MGNITFAAYRGSRDFWKADYKIARKISVMTIRYSTGARCVPRV